MSRTTLRKRRSNDVPRRFLAVGCCFTLLMGAIPSNSKPSGDGTGVHHQRKVYVDPYYLPLGDPRKLDVNREFQKAIQREDYRLIGVFAGWETIPGLETKDRILMIDRFGLKDAFVGSDVVTSETRVLIDAAGKYGTEYNTLLLHFLKDQPFAKPSGPIRPLSVDRIRTENPSRDFRQSVRAHDFRFVSVVAIDTHEIPGVSPEERHRYLGDYQSLRGIRVLDATDYIEKLDGSIIYRRSLHYRQAVRYAARYNRLLIDYLRKRQVKPEPP